MISYINEVHANLKRDLHNNETFDDLDDEFIPLGKTGRIVTLRAFDETDFLLRKLYELQKVETKNDDL